ncbi:urease accessory protein UreE [Desulfovibrio sp. ZJ369]|uniref:urease accessory protein UreE n=1 Tax=Desulfovibrio sp. ZJ369 TaxID=2709793 RepID=UPI0013ECA9FE|nr:urease accessory protein UreE [Desulfovibrio sp. ZJ369]
MQLVEKVLGNIRESAWKECLDGAQVDTLELSQWDAQKNRLRKETAGGLLVAVSLDRDAVLHDGDVLLWDETQRRAVVCRIDLCEVLVIDLDGLRELPAVELMEHCVRLGHALGNQHWPAVAQKGRVYVPLAVNRPVMNAVMQTHHFAGISYHFAPGAEILDKLNPSQARRLFGGSERPMLGGHSHAHDHEHLHGQEESGHEHRHERRACQDCGDPDHQHEESGHECDYAGNARRNG